MVPLFTNTWPRVVNRDFVVDQKLALAYRRAQVVQPGSNLAQWEILDLQLSLYLSIRRLCVYGDARQTPALAMMELKPPHIR